MLISVVIGVISLLGAIIVSKRPENLLGLGFVIVSLLAIVLGLSEGYANYAIKINPGSLPEAETAAWLANWLCAPVVMPLLTLLFLLCISLAVLPHAGVVLLSFSTEWYRTVLPAGFTMGHYHAALGHGPNVGPGSADGRGRKGLFLNRSSVFEW